MIHGKTPNSHGACPPSLLVQNLTFYMRLLYSKNNNGYSYRYLLLYNVSASEMTRAWLGHFLKVEPIYFPSGILLLLNFS